MASYLWRKLSETEKQEIKESAKKLILEFGEVIEKLPKIKETFVERNKDRREEENIIGCHEKFRELMLKNAPKTKDDCIVAEKGAWVK